MVPVSQLSRWSMLEFVPKSIWRTHSHLHVYSYDVSLATSSTKVRIIVCVRTYISVRENVRTVLYVRS